MEQHLPKEQLLKRLAQLHEQLSLTDYPDPATLDELRRLTAEIERLVAEDEAVNVEDAEPITSGLRNLLLKFEAEHPQLAVAIGKVADALAAIGI